METKRKNAPFMTEEDVGKIADSPDVEHPSKFPAWTPKLAKKLAPTQDELNALFGREFTPKKKPFDRKKSTDMLEEFLRDYGHRYGGYEPKTKRFDDGSIEYSDYDNGQIRYYLNDDGSIDMFYKNGDANKFLDFDELVDQSEKWEVDGYDDEEEKSKWFDPSFYEEWKKKFRGE